ncbi:MAG TPA: hypothetical protein VN924_14230 [Bryobacteraceae bacterium]|jgi:hypothetical protein|nr:hypothetical protein [Bryobacteraceae bacterium]
MKHPLAAIVLPIAALAFPLCAADLAPERPRIGKVEIFKASDLRPGMQGTAWTVFAGTTPEPVPVEILGLWKNAWGPRQDIILAKLGGKAVRTNVAGGMSGSPVYIDGKLVGAVALRLSVFSPDAICGITPAELMLEINDFDQSRPSDARTPDRAVARGQVAVPGDLLAEAVAAGASPNLPRQSPMMVPIETPLMFAGFHENVLRDFGPLFEQLGITAAQGGGASSTTYTAKPVAGWETSLRPGDPVAGVLVSGDMSITGLGTVTYNDGQHVLAFGHPFFNLGPVDMPMSKGEVVMTLASQFQPNKFANATEIVGALHQDRHSGIMGVLGQESDMIPVTVQVRSIGENNAVRSQRDFRFNVFVQQKWTPYLMMVTLFNSLSELNEFKDEATYRLTGAVEMNSGPSLSLSTMQASGEMPMPAPMLLAGWWGDKFNRLYLNAVNPPSVKRVNVTVDLLPERRVASIENAWLATPEARPGDDVAVKVFLRPYRGESLERDFTLKIPEGLAKGEHKIMLSDAETINRMQTVAGMLDHYIGLPETVSLINQERSNNKLYVSLLEASPTAYYEDKTLPSLPASVLNVMQSGGGSNRSLITSPDSASEQMSLPFDYVVSGSYSLKIVVK